MQIKKNVLLFLTATFLPFVVFAYQSPGSPTGFVNDFVGLFTIDQRVALEAKLQEFAQLSSNEISVATIRNLGGDTIENFAEQLFQELGIGKKKEDNGILLLIAKDDRRIRIETGYGLEGALTDAQSFAIIDRIIKPAFQAGNFYVGIDGAIDAIIAATKGEYVAPQERSMSRGVVAPQLLQLLILLGFIWISKILGKSESWWEGGVIGGVIGIIVGLLQGFLYSGIIAMGILIPLGLLFDFFVSRSYAAHRSHGHWWFGGHGGGWGGGGFGGFGGGSSGGGGASGRW